MSDMSREQAQAALEALQCYQQEDIDGIMVLVSRQAIHEVVDYVHALEAMAGDRWQDISTAPKDKTTTTKEQNSPEQGTDKA